MSKRTRLTDIIIEKVWGLYNRGYEPKVIAAKLGISSTSVLRCITAMSLASSGKFVEYTGLLQDSHYVADYANARFNLAPEALDNSDVDDEVNLTAAVLLLASNIEKQTKLLEKFLKKLES